MKPKYLFAVVAGFYIPVSDITENTVRLHPCYVVKPFNLVRPNGKIFSSN